MIFNEPEFIDVTPQPTSFIYFLMEDNNEVVYVGKTSNGLSRISQHRKEGIKEFNKVYIIPVDKKDLDEMEDFYMKKLIL